MMPLPNEHAARLKSPGDFDPKTFRRTAGGTIYGSIKVPASIGIIWGKLKGSAKPSDMPIPQSLRFAKDKWTVGEAKKWLKDNKVKYQSFEPAKEEDSMEKNIERRFAPLEVRADTENEQPVISGQAAVYNTRTELMPGLFEEIKPGAFDGPLKNDDVRGLWNHNSDYPLGRESAGTLKMRNEKDGPHYKIFPPDTQMGRDAVISIKRGDVTGSSFSFVVAPGGDQWENNEDGTTLRTITEIKSVYDVGPVTFPAYEGADVTVAARSRDAFIAEQEPPQEEAWETEARERELELAEANG